MINQSFPIIDMHVHLAGLGQNGTGCYIAPHKFDSLLYRLMRYKLGIYTAHKSGELDQAYWQRLEDDVSAGIKHGALDAVVLFAHDRIHTDYGEPDQLRLELYAPNEYVFACCERPAVRGRFLPAMSIHPYRRDALDETEKWIARGAVAMKWLPNSQNIDPQDPRCVPMYDLLARRNIPLIAHAGGEHTVSICNPRLGSPELLRPALDHGVTVIAAHCATKSGFFDTNWLPQFIELARRNPNFWGDTSAFCTPGRTRWMKPLLEAEGVAAKLIHGSDYPVPPTAWTLLFKFGWHKTSALQNIWSFLERDIRIKREMGFPEAVFRNAANVLKPGSLDFWNVRAPKSPELAQ